MEKETIDRVIKNILDDMEKTVDKSVLQKKLGFRVFVVQIKHLYDNVCNSLYPQLVGTPDFDLSHLYGIFSPFKNANNMREALRSAICAEKLLDPNMFATIDDCIHTGKPFVIIIMDGEKIWGVVAPQEKN